MDRRTLMITVNTCIAGVMCLLAIASMVLLPSEMGYFGYAVSVGFALLAVLRAVSSHSDLVEYDQWINAKR